MYNHAPNGYECPFCQIAAGVDNGLTAPADVVCRDEWTTAFVASHWWLNNAGHVIVIPNQHIENIYDMPADIAARVHETARQAAIALKRVYRCDGVSTRQHNEPAGDQEVWHYHLHVFPRYANDYLYDLTFHRRQTTPDERRPYAERLRMHFASLVGG
ncbi:MAG: HIT family protein [Anaerolineae bacterium]